MKTDLKFFIGALIAFVLFSGVVFAQDKEESVTERILKILIEKKIINQDQYKELMAQLKKEKEKKESKVRCGYKRGFYIETADKQNKIKLTGRFHGDFKAYLSDHPDNDSFFVRRARLAMKGTFYKHYDFMVESEFGKGKAQLNDGYMNIHYFPQFQIKFGQFKTPFSMEELHSDNWIDFIERSLANKLVPSRDIGIMFHGRVFDGILYYQTGIFNGYKKNQASDKDNGKDVAFRLVVAPFKGSSIEFLKELRLGGAITYGNEELKASDWWNKGKLTTAAGTTYLKVKPDALQDGRRFRKGAELYWAYNSICLKSEYMHVSLDDLKLNNTNKDVYLKGGYISLVYNITGEKFVYKNGKPGRVIPNKNFKLDFSGLGAVQVGIRYEFTKADKDLFRYGFVDPSLYTDKAQAVTLGLNWYPNDMVRFMFNYYHVKFDDDIKVSDQKIDNEDVFLSRFEIVF